MNVPGAPISPENHIDPTEGLWDPLVTVAMEMRPMDQEKVLYQVPDSREKKVEVLLVSRILLKDRAVPRREAAVVQWTWGAVRAEAGKQEAVDSWTPSGAVSFFA